ncbi:MAG: DUF1853 family protein [Gammaproteobacteria bacterium]|jgi:hypothetical protein
MIEYLSHPFVRDLCWAMESPSLITDPDCVVNDSECESVIANNQEWLRQLDARPEALVRWIEQQLSPRLGYYFEQLVAFWLQQKIAPGRVTSHVRVFQDKRVLGEYDFLFVPPGREVIEHWETAVKFYLRFEDRDGHNHWYGPNPSDTLDNKLSRMLNHQLQLSEFPQAAPVLKRVTRDVFHFANVPPVVSRAFFKGYLFYSSREDWGQPSVIPSSAAPFHLRGWWTRMSDPHIPVSGTDVRYMVLPRLKWLAPARVDSGTSSTATSQQLRDNGQLHEQLSRHFDQSQQPLLVAVLEPDVNGQWREQSRGFVVGTNWPVLPG